MKAYAVQWGFYSSYDGQEWDSIWTTEEGAKKRIQEEAKNSYKKLEHISDVFKKYKDRKDLTTYTDGDYWIDYVEIYLDTRNIHGGNDE